jgi:geranylgeranyl diphosphate synthase type I
MNSNETALEATLSEYADRSSDRLESRLSDGQPTALYEAARHPIQAGGERLRSVICLLVAEALGVDVDEQESIMPAAAAVELVHTSLLVHGDLINERTAHQDEPAVQTEWDMPTAILAGDVLFPKAFETLLDTDASPETLLTCQSELLNGCRQLCEGQAIDCSFDQGRSPTETEYIEMARLKTGGLFEVAARIGAILAENNGTYTDRVGAYGRNLGIAYHICNDVRNIMGDAESHPKIPSRDVRQGKETLITSHARQHGLDLSVLDDNAGNVVSTFESTGSIKYARNRAMEYAQTAQRFLNPFPETPARRHLCGLADMVIDHVE